MSARQVMSAPVEVRGFWDRFWAAVVILIAGGVVVLMFLRPEWFLDCEECEPAPEISSLTVRK